MRALRVFWPSRQRPAGHFDRARVTVPPLAVICAAAAEADGTRIMASNAAARPRMEGHHPPMSHLYPRRGCNCHVAHWHHSGSLPAKDIAVEGHGCLWIAAGQFVPAAMAGQHGPKACEGWPGMRWNSPNAAPADRPERQSARFPAHHWPLQHLCTQGNGAGQRRIQILGLKLDQPGLRLASKGA